MLVINVFQSTDIGILLLTAIVKGASCFRQKPETIAVSKMENLATQSIMLLYFVGEMLANNRGLDSCCDKNRSDEKRCKYF